MSTEGNRFEPAAAQNLLALFVFQDWDRVKEMVGALQKEMKAALRVAVRKTGQWANREGARGLAKASNVPLHTLRKGLRIKFQYQSIKGYSTARLWYGLNPISLKYLGAKQQKKGVRARSNTYKGGFISGALGGHAFQRVGKGRLPIKQLDHSIESKSNAFLTAFETQVAAKFVEFFFIELDKATGRDEGDSAGIVGNLNIARR